MGSARSKQKIELWFEVRKAAPGPKITKSNAQKEWRRIFVGLFPTLEIAHQEGKKYGEYFVLKKKRGDLNQYRIRRGYTIITHHVISQRAEMK